MKQNFNTIGLAFTGRPDALESFFSNAKSGPDVKNIVSDLKHEIFDKVEFYYFILKDTDWSDDDDIARRSLCYAASEAELSYCFCLLNTRTDETILDFNLRKPFFDHRVRRLFGLRRTVEFQDLRCRKFKDWMSKNFERSELKDIGRYEVGQGWSYLAYDLDTVGLFEKYHDDIWERLDKDRIEGGYKTIHEMVTVLNGANVFSNNQFKNLLVWYAAAKIAREITEFGSDDNSDDSDDTEQ